MERKELPLVGMVVVAPLCLHYIVISTHPQISIILQITIREYYNVVGFARYASMA